MPAGNKPIKVTKAMCAKARKHAALGLTKEQIAKVLGLGKSTLYEKLIKHPELLDAIDLGRTEGIGKVTNALFKNCIKGDTAAQKYYLNNRDNENWKDRIVTTNTHTFDFSGMSDQELEDIASGKK